MKTVHYFMSPVSPWSYLGHKRFLAMANTNGARVILRPIDLGRVFPQSGGLPLAKRAPQRQAYRLHELPRWRDRVGVPLNVHPTFFPAPPDDAARLIIAADLALGTEAALKLAGAFMSAVWAEDRNIADAPPRAAIVAEQGIDAAVLEARAEDARKAFDTYTEEAIAAQVFGVPWYVVDGEPFWGQDRLDFVARALERT